MKKEDVSPSGQPIYRYEEPEQKEWSPPDYGDEEEVRVLEDHLERTLGKIDAVFHEVLSELIHVDVYHVKPTDERPWHTLYTIGMSHLPMNVPAGYEENRYAELMICLPPEWPVDQEAFGDENVYWPVRWLKMLARFPHEHGTWLGFGHSMPNGDPAEPLSEQTELCGVLLLPPILGADEFREVQVGPDKTVHFYAVIPVYQEEMDFKLKNGVDSLLDLFDEHDVSEVLNLNRPNACAKKSKWKFWKK